MDARERLMRTIMVLEQSLPDMRARLEWYPPENLERKYTEKFIASMESELAKAKQELADLDKAASPPK
ncbi:MAG: hypothetical protein HYV15_01730 [Elusimicrobia bacterium]|nr:hypothetical protein [Elusimicrobiota bacterium]